MRPWSSGNQWLPCCATDFELNDMHDGFTHPMSAYSLSRHAHAIRAGDKRPSQVPKFRAGAKDRSGRFYA